MHRLAADSCTGNEKDAVRVFITGVSSGIGRELTRQLVAGGHEVWGVARRVEAMQTLAAELGDSGFRYSQCDIAEPAACAAVRREMDTADYLPDAVVLNAALDLDDAAPGLDAAQSARIMRTNYDGAHYWIAAFVEPFLRRGSGQFVGISSILAHWPDPGSVSYAASKAALSMMFRGLRDRYAHSDIKFKLLYLGPVDTPINSQYSEQHPASSSLVASATDTAKYIAHLLHSEHDNFYFPFYIRVILITLRWLPDRWYSRLTSALGRR